LGAIEMADVLLNDAGHGHAQGGLKILHGHRFLPLSRLQKIRQLF